jgi:hypothetical protein
MVISQSPKKPPKIVVTGKITLIALFLGEDRQTPRMHMLFELVDEV